MQLDIKGHPNKHCVHFGKLKQRCSNIGISLDIILVVFSETEKGFDVGNNSKHRKFNNCFVFLLIRLCSISAHHMTYKSNISFSKFTFAKVEF